MKNFLKRKKYFYALSVLVCLLGVSENAWAAGGGTHYISATTADPAQGLVYLSKNNESNVKNSSFKNTQPGGSGIGKDYAGCYTEGNGTGCTPTGRTAAGTGASTRSSCSASR